jgi:alpha-L-rhamnosidase
MRAWVDQVAGSAGAGRLWDTGFQLGDWLDPHAPPDDPERALTDPSIVATAYFARSAEVLGHAAGVLGRHDDAAHYLDLAGEVRAAFRAAYVTPAGRLAGETATAYALALQFALLPDAEQRRTAGERLAAVVRDAGYHIGTGFVGTPLICDALCEAGAEDAVYRLLLQRECPSWLYPVTMGATTIWERWDSLLPDGSVNPGEMTSFNHYALGAVADWLQRTVAGLAPAAPGYRRLLIRPRPGGGLTAAHARHRTPFGIADVAWRLEAGQMHIAVEIPPNTTASVLLPGAAETPIEVGAGRHQWTLPYPAPPPPQPVPVLDRPLGELLGEPGAVQALARLLRRHVPNEAESLANEAALLWNRAMTLRQMIAALPQAEAIMQDLASGQENAILAGQ